MPLFFFLASLAVAAQPLPRLVSSGFTLAVQNGQLTVVQVRAGSPAEIAGVLPGDVLVQPPPDPRTLLRRPAGSGLPLLIRRDGHPLSLSLRFLAPPAESQPDFDILYGTLAVDGHRRRTIRTQPRGSNGAPVVLWLAGSGCASQESPESSAPGVQLLYALTRAGYRTLRVEKTGVGDSEGPACYGPEGDLQQEVRAYAAAISMLRPAKIFLLGHSAGATLAPLVLRAAGKVEGIIVAGGMGTRFYDYVLEMRRRQLALAQQPVAAEMAIHARCLDALLNKGESPDAIEAAMPDCRRRVRFDSPPVYISQWAKLDIAKAWQAAPAVPVLVMHGSQDQVTSLQQSTLLTAHISRARLMVLPMDHDFNEEGPPVRLHQGAVQAALQFLQENR